MLKLRAETAFITGLDSGIGQQTAIALAEEGANIAVSYHTDQTGAEHTKQELEKAGGKAVVFQFDVRDPNSVDTFFQKATEALGTPDILIVNAGAGMSGMPNDEIDDAKLEEISRTDLMGPLFTARPFIRLRKQAGGDGRYRRWAARPMAWPRRPFVRWCAASASNSRRTRSTSMPLRLV